MSYLSRVEIDINNRQKMRNLTHLGAYHNWVEKSFPDEIHKQTRSRKLWRIDRISDRYYLLIVSENRPNLSRLEDYGVESSAEFKDYSGFLNQLKDGMKAQFKVTLNPVVSKANQKDQNGRGRVLPLLSDDDQMRYLMNRSEKNGFLLKKDDFIITDKGFDILKKQKQKELRLSKATYQGNLTIVNAERFRIILTEGIGQKKAYGFGMMTIIPEK